MNGIAGPPNTYDFGTLFNYALWTENTRATLVNVPWNNDYRDIVKFPTAAGVTRNQYIDSLEGAGIVIENVSYLKPNMPIRLQIPFNKAVKYNYLRASNPVQPITGADIQRDFYYFITDVRYVAPDTTEFVLQLDVWQSYSDDARFGNCYIERGHIGIANSNAFNNFGRDYLTIPEGIDVGGEYQVVTKRSKPIMSYDLTGGGDINTAVAFDFLIVSSIDLLGDPGTRENPDFQTPDGENAFTLPSGAAYYIIKGNDNSFTRYMTGMKAFPWITQGIMSITAIPPITRYIPGFVYLDGLPTPAPTQLLPPRLYAMFPDWRNSDEIINNIPERYRGLKKLFTYPYMAVELTMFTGTPIVLKPESWNDSNAAVTERFAPTPPNQRVAINPYKYNSVPHAPTDSLIPGLPISGANLGDDGGDYVDLITVMANFPTFAIVNDGAISYLASNAHGIAFQQKSADWSQQRALNSNQVSYDQASSGMNLANELTGIGRTADTNATGIANNLAAQKAVLSGAASIAGGIGGGAAGIAGGAASAAMGGIGTAMDINASQQSLAVRNAAANQSNRASVGNQGFVRDTNKNLADFSARGDYQNTIAGINAKVQDANLIQPTTSGQVGGETLNIVNNNAVISARFKMVDQSAIRVVGEYWLRYGYAVRQFATPPASLRVMSKFSYWKLSETYLIATTMPEGFKQVIRGIFEKGVTLWSDPAYIGVTDIADNTPLGGISL